MLGLKRPVEALETHVCVNKKKKKKMELQARKDLSQDHPAGVEVRMQDRGQGREGGFG